MIECSDEAIETMTIGTTALVDCIKQRNNPHRDEWVKEYMPAVFDVLRDGSTQDAPETEEAVESWEVASTHLAVMTLQFAMAVIPIQYLPSILNDTCPLEVLLRAAELSLKD